VDLPDPPLGEATVTTGMAQNRYVELPDLSHDRVVVNTGLLKISGFSHRPVMDFSNYNRAD
jgi:hypothetical protein